VTDLIDELVAGAVERVTAWADGTLARSTPPPRSVLPGSFNPLHDAHLLLARVAQEFTGVAEKTALISEALKALIERESARRLASLGSTMPRLKAIPRRRRPN